MAFLRKYKELLLGVAMILIAAAYLVATARIEIRVVTTFNARFVPYILGTICLVLGLLQCAGALREARATAEGGRSDPRAVVTTFLIIAVYVATLRSAGFLLNTIWMMFLVMLLLCPRERRRPLLFAGISIATSAIIYYVFRNWLDLMLPDGILG